MRRWTSKIQISLWVKGLVAIHNLRANVFNLSAFLSAFAKRGRGMRFPQVEREKWGKERSWVVGAGGTAGRQRDGTMMTLATWWHGREASGDARET